MSLTAQGLIGVKHPPVLSSFPSKKAINKCYLLRVVSINPNFEEKQNTYLLEVRVPPDKEQQFLKEATHGEIFQIRNAELVSRKVKGEADEKLVVMVPYYQFCHLQEAYWHKTNS